MGILQSRSRRKDDVLVTWNSGGMVECSSWRQRGARRRPCLLVAEVNGECRLESGGGGVLGPYCHCLRVLYRTFGGSLDKCSSGDKKVEGTSSDFSCTDKKAFVSRVKHF